MLLPDREHKEVHPNLKEIFIRLGGEEPSALVLLGEKEAADFPFDLLAGQEAAITFVAAGGEEERIVREKLPAVSVSRRDDPSCIDHLKIRTGGRGYDIVIVWDSDPAAVRMALGAAAVLAEVVLFFVPRRKVVADLHSTINYKGLKIRMGVSE